MHLLHSASDCCRLEPGGYGVKYGGFLGASKEAATSTACGALCLGKPSCAFFSFSGRFSKCVLCATCELEAHASFVEPKIRSLSEQYASYSLQPREAFGAPSAAASGDGLEMLNRLQLQGAYSRRLYGRKGAVDLASLRVLWLDLLPAPSLRLLNQTTGVCKLDASLPSHPFFSAIDLYSNPTGAVWLSSRRHRSPPLAIPNHTYVEVSHCAQGSGWELEATSKPRPAWKCKPMWLYVAPGSGVSINVTQRPALTPDRMHTSTRTFS